MQELHPKSHFPHFWRCGVCVLFHSTVRQAAKELTSCPWDRKKGFWQVASIAMAEAMRHAKKNKIVIAVHKELKGKYSLFNSILYQLELSTIGWEMFQHSEWKPTFEVREIPMAESSDCTVAPWLKRRLERVARRSVAMTCSLCPHGLGACGSQRQVTTAEMTSMCTGDCWNGKGNKTYASGNRYEGDFKNGMEDGKGKYFFASGSRYEGDFKKGKMDGKGKLFHASGNRYEGDFKNGKYDGKGKYFYASGYRYEGDWKNGVIDGKGKDFYANGDSYEGDFKNGKRDGKGKYFYADGSRYEGDFKSDRRDGRGKCFASGKSKECCYEMGKKIKCKVL